MNPGVDAESNSGQKHSCKWRECKGTPHPKPIKIPEDYPNNGITKRGSCEKWSKPFDIQRPSYTNYGVKEGEFVGLKSTKYKITSGKSDCNKYITQPHHVIPVTAMESFGNLAHNLTLLGWDINDEESNGICLPYFKEDQIWHCLQPHRGSHPKKYTKHVKEVLKEAEKNCKSYCIDSEKENSKKDDPPINQWTLCEDMSTLVNKIRNGILDWTIHIHRVETLEKWAEEVETRSNKRIGRYYKPGAAKSSAPSYKQQQYSGREYL